MKAKILIPIIFLFITVKVSAGGPYLVQGGWGFDIWCENQTNYACFDYHMEEHSFGIASVNHKWFKNGVLVSTNYYYCATDTGHYYSTFYYGGWDGTNYMAGAYTSPVWWVKYLPTPEITLHGDTLICSYAYNYQWYFNSQLIVGATSQTYIALQYGNYKVVTSVTSNTSSCSKSFEINYLDPTPISDLTLFPNPSTGNFTATLPTGTTQLEIVNMLGEQVENKTVESETSIDFTLLNNGIYFISAVTDSGILRKKIVVSR